MDVRLHLFLLFVHLRCCLLDSRDRLLVLLALLLVVSALVLCARALDVRYLVLRLRRRRWRGLTVLGACRGGWRSKFGRGRRGVGMLMPL